LNAEDSESHCESALRIPLELPKQLLEQTTNFFWYSFLICFVSPNVETELTQFTEFFLHKGKTGEPLLVAREFQI
jgi:hypothetical protein